MVTPADVEAELDLTAAAVGLSATEFDELLSELIDRETERVEDEIDVVLGTVTETVPLSRPEHVPPYDLPMPDRPVQSVTGVTIDTDRADEPDVTADDYAVHDSHLELLPSADRDDWPTERRSIEVEYEHGYPDGDEPKPIRGAIIGLVRHAVQEIDSDGINSESIDGQSVDYEVAEAVLKRHLYRAKRFDEPDYYGGANVI